MATSITPMTLAAETGIIITTTQNGAAIAVGDVVASAVASDFAGTYNWKITVPFPYGDASSDTSILKIDGVELVPITGSTYTADTYLAKVAEGTTSISLVVPEGYYIRCSSEYFSAKTYASTAVISESDWYDSGAAVIAHENSGSPDVTTFLDSEGYETIEDYLSDVHGYSSIEEYLDDYGIEDISEYWADIFNSNSYANEKYVVQLKNTPIGSANFNNKFGSSSVTYDNASTYYLFEICSVVDGIFERTAPVDAAVLVQIGGTVVSPADKTLLISAIDKATANGFYTSNDRYNGKAADTITASDDSFWAQMQAVLTVAQRVNSDTSATQSQVDAATETLTAAINKLIPKENVNATELYELVNTEYKWWGNDATPAGPGNISLTSVTADNTTTESWTAYAAELASAKAMLASLYVQEAGENQYQPTDINIANYQSTVDEQTAALKAAVAALDKKVDTLDGLPRAQEYYAWLKAFTNTHFNKNRLNEAGYTSESWVPYLVKWNEASTYLENHTTPPTESFGAKELNSLEALCEELFTASYGLVGSGDTVSVAVTVVDNYAARKDGVSFDTLTGLHSVSFDSGSAATLQALLSELSWSMRTLTPGDVSQVFQIYINGTQVNVPSGASALSYTLSNYVSRIYLQDGDKVTLAYLQQPTRNASSMANQEGYPIGSIKTLLRIANISGNSEGTVGMPLTLTVSSALSWPSGYTGTTSPLSGATVFVSSAPTASEDTITAATENSGVITGADGSFALTFYGEGWYEVSVYHLGENKSGETPLGNGLIAGATMKVHISPAANETTVVSSLLAELENAYSVYDVNYYSAENWSTLTGYYQTARDEMNAQNVTPLAAKAALDTAIANMKAVTTIDHAGVMARFRTILSWVPDPTFYTLSSAENEKTVMGWMKTEYEKLNDYQRSQLTGAETAKIRAVLQAYGEDGSTLPEPQTYKITYNLLPADGAELYSFVAVYNPVGENPSVVLERKQGESVNLAVNYGKDYRFVPNPDGSYSYTADITVNGDQPLHYNNIFSWRPLKDVLDFKQIGVKVSHLTGGQVYVTTTGFTMPGADITVDIRLTRTTTTDPLASQRKIALTELENAYSGYSKADYTAENWAELVGAYNTGVSGINAAADAAAITEKKDAALSAMDAIPEKPTGSLDGIPGWGSDSEFNAGERVGTVTVIVENTTFSGGDFYGNIINKPSYPLGKNDTMMSVVLRALVDEGYSWSNSTGKADFTISYLAYINKDGKSLGEFSGEPGSGWMGTLNDWFTNYGFAEFTAANGKLADGDEIRVMFTQNLGADLGGSWDNSDTTLTSLSVSNSKLTPNFVSGKSGGSYEYALVIPGNSASVKVTPTAANKNYLVKTFLNEKVTSNSEGNNYYKRTEDIPVTVGDIIYVGVGERAWPSMNNQETEARVYSSTWYELHVISASNGAGYANELISALPAADKMSFSNYESYRSQIAYARTIYNILNQSEQTKVASNKLTEAEERLAYFAAIQKVKTLLDAIPAADKLTAADKNKVQAAYDAYSKLDDEQKLYITIGDVAKYTEAVEWLGKQGIDSPGEITGSDKEPVQPGTTATITPPVNAENDVVEVTVSSSDIASAIEYAKNNDMTPIVIAPEITGSASKVNVEIAKDDIVDIGSEITSDLKIETPIGIVTIPNDVLISLASQANGDTISIVVEALETETLTEEQQTLVGDDAVFDISIMSGGKLISNFDGKSITISLPYTLKPDETASGVKVWYLSDDGNLEQMSCTYDEETGLATFTTNHLSYYVVGHYNLDYDTWLNPFVDVKSDDWFYEAVKYALQNGMFSGTTLSTFSPNINTSRAMLVTVLYRLEGEPAVMGENIFTDVKNGQWYSDAVTWASSNGIVSGYGNNLFGANDSITREQMVAILLRYANYKKYDTAKSNDLSTYTDASSIASYALDAMKWAKAEGLITGRTATTLVPTGTATRAEVAIILMQFSKNVAK